MVFNDDSFGGEGLWILVLHFKIGLGHFVADLYMQDTGEESP